MRWAVNTRHAWRSAVLARCAVAGDSRSQLHSHCAATPEALASTRCCRYAKALLHLVANLGLTSICCYSAPPRGARIPSFPWSLKPSTRTVRFQMLDLPACTISAGNLPLKN